MLSPSPRISPVNGSRPAVVPPPSPLLDSTADDMRRLTVEIDRVLSGRPPPARSQAQSLSAALAGAGDETDQLSAASETFGRAAAGNRGGAVAAVQAAEWLGRAKRERRVERARSAISWTVAVLFVAMIAGASAYVVRGGLPEAAAIERAMRSVGL